MPGIYGQTALAYACENSHEDIVMLLFAMSHATIDVNTKDRDGYTPLMWTCFEGHLGIFRTLLSKARDTIDLHARDEKETTAFMYSCMHGHRFENYIEKVHLSLLNTIAVSY